MANLSVYVYISNSVLTFLVTERNRERSTVSNKSRSSNEERDSRKTQAKGNPSNNKNLKTSIPEHDGKDKKSAAESRTVKPNEDSKVRGSLASQRQSTEYKNVAEQKRSFTSNGTSHGKQAANTLDRKQEMSQHQIQAGRQKDNSQRNSSSNKEFRGGRSGRSSGQVRYPLKNVKCSV